MSRFVRNFGIESILLLVLAILLLGIARLGGAVAVSNRTAPYPAHTERHGMPSDSGVSCKVPGTSCSISSAVGHDHRQSDRRRQP